MSARVQRFDNLQECCKNRIMNFFGNIILQLVSKLSGSRRVKATRFKLRF